MSATQTEKVSSRDKIIRAATKIIALKGIHGAKMEEIALEAGLNKAMVYYIFTNKDNLYLEVLKNLMKALFSEAHEKLRADIENNVPPLEIIKHYIRVGFEIFQQEKEYTKVLVDAISNGIDKIPLVTDYLVKDLELNTSKLIFQVIEKAKEDGVLRDIDSRQLILSINGMSFFYFMTESIGKLMHFDIEDEQKFLKERKESVVDLIMNGIMAK